MRSGKVNCQVELRGIIGMGVVEYCGIVADESAEVSPGFGSDVEGESGSIAVSDQPKSFAELCCR